MKKLLFTARPATKVEGSAFWTTKMDPFNDTNKETIELMAETPGDMADMAAAWVDTLELAEEFNGWTVTARKADGVTRWPNGFKKMFDGRTFTIRVRADLVAR
jgi:hypothetical protein